MMNDSFFNINSYDSKMKNILIVEDETIFALDLKRILSKSGYNVLRVFTEGARAVEFARQEKPDVILMDISLKGELNGVDAAKEIYKSYKPMVIFISALDKLAFDFTGLQYKFMSKPILDKNLISMLNYS
jgi:DNA-binding response OmpR family regulator